MALKINPLLIAYRWRNTCKRLSDLTKQFQGSAIQRTMSFALSFQ
jgi:hypothetical protein